MTEVCREWTQPDGDHFHGLCSNILTPKTGDTNSETPDGCDVCVKPIEVPA